MNQKLNVALLVWKRWKNLAKPPSQANRLNHEARKLNSLRGHRMAARFTLRRLSREMVQEARMSAMTGRAAASSGRRERQVWAVLDRRIYLSLAQCSLVSVRGWMTIMSREFSMVRPRC